MGSAGRRRAKAHRKGAAGGGASGGLLGNRFARLWAAVAPYVGDNKRSLVFVAVLSLSGGFAEAFFLFLIVRSAVAIAADETRIPIDVGPIGISLTVFGLLCVAMVALLLNLILGLLSARTTAWLSSSALGRARRQTVGAYVRSAWLVQSTEREGRLQELLTSNVARISNGVVTLATGIASGLSFLALMVTAFAVNIVAAAIILLGVVALFFLLRPITRRTKKQARLQTQVNAEYAGAVAQTVRLSPELRVFGVGEIAIQAVGAISDRVSRLVYKTRFLARATPAVYQNVAFLLVVVGMTVVYVADLGSVADLGAVVILMVRALSYSQQVQSAIQAASEVAPYIEDLQGQTDIYDRFRVVTAGVALKSVESLTFDDISFSYDADVPVLTDVTFTVRRGEVIGVVGPSGSGKSTLVQLLLRLRDPVSGTYVINGAQAADFALDDWTKACTYVPQDNKLLAGSVTDNVRFFRDWLSDEEIETSCRRAHLHEDVVGLSHGYNTLLGPGGADLSGGQRQRLGLARALVSNPSVLVLDEPTSALDMRSEALVQGTLHELKSSVTMFIVAHRMTTLSACDKILVLGRGRLEAFGPPKELHGNAFFTEALKLSQLT